jgi:hypothetical protein
VYAEFDIDGDGTGDVSINDSITYIGVDTEAPTANVIYSTT